MPLLVSGGHQQPLASLGLSVYYSRLCLHHPMALSFCVNHVFRRTPLTGLGTSPWHMNSPQFEYICKYPVSKQHHIHKYWDWDFNISVLEATYQPTTAPDTSTTVSCFITFKALHMVLSYWLISIFIVAFFYSQLENWESFQPGCLSIFFTAESPAPRMGPGTKWCLSHIDDWNPSPHWDL